jgi:plastocyanin
MVAWTSLAIVMMVVTGACGSSEPSGSGSGQKAEAQAGAPSPIDGDYFSGSSVMRFDRGEWTYVSGTIRWVGMASVSDPELVLSGEQGCPERATYAWSTTGGALTLEAVEDPCPGRQVLLGKTWEAIPALSEDTQEASIVTLPDLRFAAYWGQMDVTDQSEAEIEVFIREGIDTGGWAFSPTILVGTPGQSLELTVVNPVGPKIYELEHNFTLEDQAINVDVPVGEEQVVTVIFPQSGSLTFFCRRHVDEGQAGALTVE